MALFVDLVALSNELHGSVQMDSVALFSWIGWLRHHGIFNSSTFSFLFQSTVSIFVYKAYFENLMAFNSFLSILGSTFVYFSLRCFSAYKKTSFHYSQTIALRRSYYTGCPSWCTGTSTIRNRYNR